MFWLAQWILKKQDERFLEALIATKAQVDEVTDRQTRWVLLQMRMRRAIDPYLYIFKLGWEVVRGRYWRSGSKIHSGTNAASGGGAGAGGQPVAQSGYAFPGNSLTGTASFPSPGGLGGGNWNSSTSASPVFEDAGIVAGEVVAYRCWRLKSDGLLYSVYQSDFCWIPGESVEGDVTGSLGVHAFKSLILMAQYADTPEEMVTGTVDLWGDVYEHERGYRASKAAIRTIDDSPYYDAEALRELYGLGKYAKKPLQDPEA